MVKRKKNTLPHVNLDALTKATEHGITHEFWREIIKIAINIPKRSPRYLDTKYRNWSQTELRFLEYGIRKHLKHFYNTAEYEPMSVYLPALLELVSRKEDSWNKGSKGKRIANKF